MTGYIKWPDSQEFKPQDVVLNGGLFWRLDDDWQFRIIDDSEYLPVCSECGQSKQPNVLQAHQRTCEGETK